MNMIKAWEVRDSDLAERLLYEHTLELAAHVGGKARDLSGLETAQRRSTLTKKRRVLS